MFIISMVIDVYISIIPLHPPYFVPDRPHRCRQWPCGCAQVVAAGAAFAIPLRYICFLWLQFVWSVCTNKKICTMPHDAQGYRSNSKDLPFSDLKIAADLKNYVKWMLHRSFIIIYHCHATVWRRHSGTPQRMGPGRLDMAQLDLFDFWCFINIFIDRVFCFSICLQINSALHSKVHQIKTVRCYYLESK